MYYEHVLMTWDEGVQRRQQQQQLIQLPVVPAASLLEPKYSSNEWYNQSLGSCNRCDTDGMSNLSSLGFHILDMLMILFLLSKHLLLVLLLLLLLLLFAAAPQSHFPLHLRLLLPRALQLVVHGDGDGCQVRVVQPPPHVKGYAVASFVHSCPALLLPRLLLLLLPLLLDVAAVVSQTTASPAGLLMMGGCSLQSLAAFPHHRYRYCCSLLLPPLLLPRQN